MALNCYPYTNFHELNQDWILEQLKKVADELEEVKKTVGTVPPATPDQNGFVATVIAGEWKASDNIPSRVRAIEADNLSIRADLQTINDKLKEIYDGMTRMTQMLNEINRTVVV